MTQSRFVLQVHLNLLLWLLSKARESVSNTSKILSREEEHSSALIWISLKDSSSINLHKVHTTSLRKSFHKLIALISLLKSWRNAKSY